MGDGHIIPPAHEDMLCRMLGVDELDDHHRRAYFRCRVLWDRCQNQLRAEQLWVIAVECGRARIGRPPKTVKKEEAFVG